MRHFIQFVRSLFVSSVSSVPTNRAIEIYIAQWESEKRLRKIESDLEAIDCCQVWIQEKRLRIDRRYAASMWSYQVLRAMCPPCLN